MIKNLHDLINNKLFYNGVLAGTITTLIIVVIMLSWKEHGWGMPSISILITLVILLIAILRTSIKEMI